MSQRLSAGHHAVVELEAETALPYPHRERATAGLRAELRHCAADAGVLADWDTLEVTGPVETPDARGRAWYSYRATVTAATSR